MNRSLTLSVALIPFLLLIAVRSTAAPGDLDLDFGGFGTGGQFQNLGFTVNAMAIDAQGRLVLAGNSGGTFYVQRRSGPRFSTVESLSITINSEQSSAEANAVAIAPDGKIVVAGRVAIGSSPPDFAVARLNPDLTLDLTFHGGDGTVFSDFDSDQDGAQAVAVQSDNKIVVAGYTVTRGILLPDTHWGVERLNEDGTYDKSFNGSGQWTSSFSAQGANAIVLQDDGKILVAGDKDAIAFRIGRLNPDGSTDDSFGDGGFVDAVFEANASANSLALTPDGKIVSAGTGNFINVARYLSNGTLDMTFGTNGTVVTDPKGGTVNTASVVVQPDRKIVVAGHNILDGQPDLFIVVRYNVDGSLDPTFGTNGEVFTAFGTTEAGAHALALQSDGMLIAAGGAQAARYRWDGSLDTGGIILLAFDPNQTDGQATALAVQGDGKLVAAGLVLRGTNYDMALARLTQDRHGLDITFGNDSPQTGRTLYGFGSSEAVQAMALQPDGKGVVVGSISSPSHDADMLVGRFNTDGTPDSSCNIFGYNTVDYGFGADSADAIVIGPNARIYAAGTVRGPTNDDYGLVRLTESCDVDITGGSQINPPQYKFTADLGGDDSLAGMVLQGARSVLAGTVGSDIVLVRVTTDPVLLRPKLDVNFGTGGRAVLHTGGQAFASGLAAQADGKLIVAGRMERADSSEDLLVARFTPDGQLDPTFGVAGVAYADFDVIDGVPALAVRGDDTIAVAGCTSPGSGLRVAVAQFTASGQLDTGFNGTGKATLRLGADGEDCADAVTFLGPNHLVVGGYSSVFGAHQFALVAFETTAAAPGMCTGDCNSDGSVTVNELVTLVNIDLGSAQPSACAHGVPSGAAVNIALLIQAVNNALNGCSG